MPIRRRNKGKPRLGHLGVWDSTGGQTREGSGLPVESGEEEIQILASLEDGQVGKLSLGERRLAIAQQESLRRLGRVSPDLRVYLSDASDNQREAVDMREASRDYVEGVIEAYRMRRDERSEIGTRLLPCLELSPCSPAGTG